VVVVCAVVLGALLATVLVLGALVTGTGGWALVAVVGEGVVVVLPAEVARRDATCCADVGGDAERLPQALTTSSANNAKATKERARTRPAGVVPGDVGLLAEAKRDGKGATRVRGSWAAVACPGAGRPMPTMMPGPLAWRGATLSGQYLTVLVAATGGRGTDVLFSVLVGLHVLAGLAGFGSVGFAGFYGSRAARFRPNQPSEDTEELMRYFAKPSRMWWALVAVPFFGLGALAADPHGGGLDQFWVVGALLLWLLAALIAGGMVMPSVSQVRAALFGTRGGGLPATARGTAGETQGVAGTGASGALQPSGGGPGGEAAVAVTMDSSEVYRLVRAGALASRGAAVCDLLFLLALALMIWQP
jgi:hypothetical protein